MKSFASSGAFAAHLRRVSQAMPAAEQAGLAQAGALIEAEAKALVGTEYAGWRALAKATVLEKKRLGFTGRISATDPLLRTGELRESISHEVDGRTVVIGSDDPVAIYQETGTTTIPPRPFLAPAASRAAELAAKAVGEAVAMVIAGRR